MRHRISQFILLCLILSLGACSVYESSGRKQFESNSPGKLRTQSLGDGLIEDLASNENECWLQPANEPLWHISDEALLSVKRVSKDILEICEGSR